MQSLLYPMENSRGPTGYVGMWMGEGVKTSTSESKASITDVMKKWLKTRNTYRQWVFTVINKSDLNC